MQVQMTVGVEAEAGNDLSVSGTENAEMSVTIVTCYDGGDACEDGIFSIGH